MGFVLVLSTSVVSALTTLVVTDGGCGRDAQKTGSCPGVEASVGDGGVDVSAGWEDVVLGGVSEGDGEAYGNGAGDSAGGGWGSAGGNLGSGGDGGNGLPEGVSTVPGDDGYDNLDAASGPGREPRRGQAPVDPAVPADPGAPACEPQTPCDPALIVRANDLVSISADAPTQGMEPDGWLVVGVPTNFFASAAAHQSSGPLLGSPAEVRFTPVSFTWDYGDGATGSSASGGASWAAQGLPEFSETSTSHVYENTGTISVGLSVSYSAEYRFDGGDWREVDGLLSVPSAPMTVLAERAGTVLVAEGCSANAEGPGC
jgi:hypothetical protein